MHNLYIEGLEEKDKTRRFCVSYQFILLFNSTLDFDIPGPFFLPYTFHSTPLPPPIVSGDWGADDMK